MHNEESKESKTRTNKNLLTIDDPFEITKRLKHSKLTNDQLIFLQLIIRNENKISTINRIY